MKRFIKRIFAGIFAIILIFNLSNFCLDFLSYKFFIKNLKNEKVLVKNESNLKMYKNTPKNLIGFISRSNESARAINEVENQNKDFIDSYFDFSVNLLKNCYQSKESENNQNGKNVLISPLSIFMVLSVILAGANGGSKEQLLNLFELNDIDDFMLALKFINSNLIGDENLKTSNSCWYSNNSNFVLDSEYKTFLQNEFLSKIEGVDFLKNETIDLINNWCSENTNGMIKEIVGEDEFDENTIISLINAISFECEWLSKYENYDIMDRYFFGKDEKTIVQFLNSTENVFLSGENEIGFEKKYQGERYSFVAILPNEEISIDDYVNSLTGENLKKLFNNKTNREVDCSLPKFSSEYNILLENILMKMGVKNIFSKDTSDLSGIGKLETNENIFIEKIIHKTKIEVSNLGTKASAVTSATMSKCSLSRDMPRVVLNRPFVYFIMDLKTNLPIFAGVVENI